MDRNQKGFTLIEILVVVTIIGVLAGLVVVLIPKGQFEAKKTECMNNVRNLCALLIIDREFPKKYGGADLILQLIPQGEIEGEENLRKLLFCPGDPDDSFEDAGKEKAYDDLSLSKPGEHGHLTSYAGRDQKNKACRAMKGSTKQVILICDDSDTHHDRKGFVIGLTDGSVKFRHKFNDSDRNIKETIELGDGSPIEALQCMRAE